MNSQNQTCVCGHEEMFHRSFSPQCDFKFKDKKEAQLFEPIFCKCTKFKPQSPQSHHPATEKERVVPSKDKIVDTQSPQTKSKSKANADDGMANRFTVPEAKDKTEDTRKGCGKRFFVRDLLSKKNKDGSERYSLPRKAICGEYGKGNVFIDLCDSCSNKTPPISDGEGASIPSRCESQQKQEKGGENYVETNYAQEDSESEKGGDAIESLSDKELDFWLVSHEGDKGFLTKDVKKAVADLKEDLYEHWKKGKIGIKEYYRILESFNQRLGEEIVK